MSKLDDIYDAMVNDLDIPKHQIKKVVVFTIKANNVVQQIDSDLYIDKRLFRVTEKQKKNLFDNIIKDSLSSSEKLLLKILIEKFDGATYRHELITHFLADTTKIKTKQTVRNVIKNLSDKGFLIEAFNNRQRNNIVYFIYEGVLDWQKNQKIKK